MMIVRQKILIIKILILAGLLFGCNNRSEVEYKDMETLLKSLAKNKSVKFNKFPPRLVKAFLKLEKSNHEGLQELLDMSKLFVVIHVEKSNKGSHYKIAKNEVRHYMKKSKYKKLIELNLERIYFKEFYHEHNSKTKEIVLEIDEKDLYTVYCLKGEFTKEDIIRVSNKVSPVEFLELNWKIRTK